MVSLWTTFLLTKWSIVGEGEREREREKINFHSFFYLISFETFQYYYSNSNLVYDKWNICHEIDEKF